MKSVLISFCLLLSGCAGQQPYFKVGAGYKFDEPEIYWFDHTRGVKRTSDPISARFELGVEYKSLNYGISHHSNWFDGWPFNSLQEHHKTELFVDYTYKFKVLN